MIAIVTSSSMSVNARWGAEREKSMDMGGFSCVSWCVEFDAGGRGCRGGIGGWTAGEKHRGRREPLGQTEATHVPPPGGARADDSRPWDDGHRPGEVVAGEAPRRDRGLARRCRGRVAGGGGTVRRGLSEPLAGGVAAVAVATGPGGLRAGRGPTRGGRALRRLWATAAAAAVIVRDGGKQRGRQVRGQAEGHEKAMGQTGLEHGRGPYMQLFCKMRQAAGRVNWRD